MTDELLFCDGELAASLRQIRHDMLDAIQNESERYLLNVDEGDWADYLADEYAVACPELNTESKEIVDLGETQVDVSHHPGRAIFDRDAPTYWPGRRLRLRIPFTGDGGVFRMQARTRSYNPPRATVAQRELHVTHEFPHDSKPDLQGEINRLVNQLEQHLRWSRADIDEHNAGLRDEALQAIRARKQRVLSDHEFLDRLGIPVRRRDDAPTTLAAPGIERRPALYEHVIGLIRSMGRTMERSPEIYGRHEEEQLRDQLLAMLNSHYQGQATGETFNAAGKTDILVRVDDRNVFIGECKWWSGPADFLKAIEQLFSYSTWRDTKLAPVIFVRAKGLTAVIGKARAELAHHPEFIDWQGVAEGTELRCRTRWPGDPERHADLAVSFFHLATQARH